MIKKLILLVVIIFLIIGFVTREEGDIFDRGVNKIYPYWENIKEGAESLFQEKVEEKKGIVEEEIQSEIEKIEEDLKEKGESVWHRIGDSIFGRE